MGITALFLLAEGGSEIARLKDSLLMKLLLLPPLSLPSFLSSLRFFWELS
jgi:hypothetical protein